MVEANRFKPSSNDAKLLAKGFEKLIILVEKAFNVFAILSCHWSLKYGVSTYGFHGDKKPINSLRRLKIQHNVLNLGIFLVSLAMCKFLCRFFYKRLCVIVGSRNHATKCFS